MELSLAQALSHHSETPDREQLKSYFGAYSSSPTLSSPTSHAAPSFPTIVMVSSHDALT